MWWAHLWKGLIWQSTPTYNDEQVCLNDSKDWHTTMNIIVDITIQNSKFA